MNKYDIARMVTMVRAVRAGKWTTELPDWAHKHAETPEGFGLHLGATQVLGGLQEMPSMFVDELRAVQTAEAFILLAHASDYPFDETAFLRDCGFLG